MAKLNIWKLTNHIFFSDKVSGSKGVTKFRVMWLLLREKEEKKGTRK
jgi:hypothetical protein